jgi:hypothetical protein
VVSDVEDELSDAGSSFVPLQRDAVGEDGFLKDIEIVSVP